MSTGESSTANAHLLESEWDKLAVWIEETQSQPTSSSAPIPMDAHPKVKMFCTQAFVMGKQAASHPEIMGPQFLTTDCDNQQFLMYEYFSLGMDSCRAIKLSASTLRQEGNRPDVFYEDCDKFKAFSRQLALWFGQNPNDYKFDNEKICFAASYIHGEAFEWLEPFVNESNGKVQFDTFDNLMRALKAAFVDSDSYATSERERDRSTLKYTSCSAYFSRFSPLTLRLSWKEDAAKIHQFRRGLKDGIKDMLVGRDVPSTINEFAALCIKLDNQNQARAQEKKSMGPPKLHNNPLK